ncbi:MAG: hypothetical protein H7Y37_15040 [Anaerolineae bacterium]|nr:hypothetical protein [Gloeobacterales cyanobacterium ES-bin-313]
MNKITNAKIAFLYPRSSYRGPSTPEALAFNRSLQDFTHHVSYICALETGGNLSPEEAFQGLESLWLQFERKRPQI